LSADEPSETACQLGSQALQQYNRTPHNLAGVRALNVAIDGQRGSFFAARLLPPWLPTKTCTRSPSKHSYQCDLATRVRAHRAHSSRGLFPQLQQLPRCKPLGSAIFNCGQHCSTCVRWAAAARAAATLEESRTRALATVLAIPRMVVSYKSIPQTRALWPEHTLG